MSVDFSRFFWKWSAPAAAAVGDMLNRELMRHAKRLTGLFESFEEAFRTGTRGEFWVPIQLAKKLLENPLENPLEISYTEKTPKIGTDISGYKGRVCPG